MKKFDTQKEVELRMLVCQEALTWVGTPFRFACLQKGKGADCAEYAIQPYKVAGLIELGINVPRQLRDWLLAGKEVDPTVFRRFIERFAVRIPYEQKLPGDLVTFNFLGVESHVGILVESDPDWMVDAVTRGTVRKRRLQSINSLEAVYRHVSFSGDKSVIAGLEKWQGDRAYRPLTSASTANDGQQQGRIDQNGN